MSSAVAYNKKLITAPATEPVTTATMKTWLYVTESDHDALIDGLVKAARQWVEKEKDGALITQTWDLYLDEFPRNGTAINLMLYPVISVTSLKYYDADGVEQTWDGSNYSLFTGDKQPPCIIPTPDTDYPETQDRQNAVTIRVVAGYGAAGDIPENILTAIKMLVKFWYDQPEDMNAKGRPWERTAKILIKNEFPLWL